MFSGFLSSFCSYLISLITLFFSFFELFFFFSVFLSALAVATSDFSVEVFFSFLVFFFSGISFFSVLTSLTPLAEVTPEVVVFFDGTDFSVAFAHFSTSFSSFSLVLTFLLSLDPYLSFYSWWDSGKAFFSSFLCSYEAGTFFNFRTLTFPANFFFFSTKDSFFSTKGVYSFS